MGENIRLLRGSMGLTIEKLAEKAKLSAPYMGAIERGEKWPRPETIERIARVLNVSAINLFNPDNSVPYNIQKLAKELINEFETTVGKTVRKMNGVVKKTEKS
jgi:transcriptional regulator with XRE-family HTH domain